MHRKEASMLQFNEQSFAITVDCGCNPIEDWLMLHDDIISLLQSQDKDMLANHYAALDLLRQMMPDIKSAQKMIEKQKV